MFGQNGKYTVYFQFTPIQGGPLEHTKSTYDTLEEAQVAYDVPVVGDLAWRAIRDSDGKIVVAEGFEYPIPAKAVGLKKWGPIAAGAAGLLTGASLLVYSFIKKI